MISDIGRARQAINCLKRPLALAIWGGSSAELLDGIPAIFFLPMYPVEQLVERTRRAVELFHPRLILVISDEIPPDGDIERVRMVGELVRELV